MNKTVYDIITDRILNLLEEGTIPWQKPWHRTGNVEFDWPKNLTSKRPYSGINVFLLSCAGFGSPFWLTYKQAAAIGANIKQGEKGFPVIFWKIQPKKIKDESGEERSQAFPILRYYTVFNVEQCENIDPDKIPTCPAELEGLEFNPIESAQALVENMKNPPEIAHYNNSDRACYSPTFDKVSMPAPEQFKTPEKYYCTLFHELAHSTGHSKRLNRKELTESSFYGSHNYSKEELVAEFAAAFLCGVSGIDQATLDNSAAYIKGWSSSLRKNPKWAVLAAAAAQKAADLIQGIHGQELVSGQETSEAI